MTRDEIMNMPAGEEIDKLVAEKVMGWHIVETRDGGRDKLVDRDGRYQHAISRYDHDEDEEDFHTIYWHPSESILWAWEVIEKFHAVNLTHRGKYWFCDLGEEDYDYSQADTAQLAICRAALLAVLE